MWCGEAINGGMGATYLGGVVGAEDEALLAGPAGGEADEEGGGDPGGAVVPRLDRALAHLLEAWGADELEDVGGVLEAAHVELEREEEGLRDPELLVALRIMLGEGRGGWGVSAARFKVKGGGVKAQNVTIASGTMWTPSAYDCSAGIAPPAWAKGGSSSPSSSPSSWKRGGLEGLRDMVAGRQGARSCDEGVEDSRPRFVERGGL